MITLLRSMLVVVCVLPLSGYAQDRVTIGQTGAKNFANKIERQQPRVQACAQFERHMLRFTNGISPQKGSAVCNTVQSCNELISDCIASGGEFETLPGGHDPDTGAPDYGICSKPADC